MYFDAGADNQARGNGAAPPPGGATFASFVLFASLATLVAFGYLAGEWLGLQMSGFGFPSDAAWVRAVFARSVAAGHGLTFTSSAPVAGVAAPSWIVVFGLAALPTGDYILTGKLLGVLCVILSAFLAWGITLRLLADWRFAFIAGLLVVTSPLLSEQALGGTEGAFAGMLVLAVIYWQGLGWEGARRQRVTGAVALGLAALARPELILLLPAILLDRWLVATLHSRPGERLRDAVVLSFPEALGALLVALPYVVYNGFAGGPRWQQPDLTLQVQPALAWAKLLLVTLWGSNPVVLALAAAGLLVAALAPARERAEDPSFLPTLLPLVLIPLPGVLWPYADPANAKYSATYLVPLVSILGAAGLYLLYRLAQGLTRRLAPNPEGAGRVVLMGALVLLALAGLFGVIVPTHWDTWDRHKEQVLREQDVYVDLGKRAAQLLPSDAAIASREVGAIGFFANRRMIDLGGSISMEGIGALRGAGSADTKLLAYMSHTKPSYAALRPGDFPYLTQRLEPVVTCMHIDKSRTGTGGSTSLVLYQTPWLAPSMQALQKAPE